LGVRVRDDDGGAVNFVIVVIGELNTFRVAIVVDEVKNGVPEFGREDEVIGDGSDNFKGGFMEFAFEVVSVDAVHGFNVDEVVRFFEVAFREDRDFIDAVGVVIGVEVVLKELEVRFLFFVMSVEAVEVDAGWSVNGPNDFVSVPIRCDRFDIFK